MSEMVERVARELNEKLEKLQVGRLTTKASKSLARAAIAAMREPTKDMEIAGYTDEMCHGHDTGNAWRHMIDAALK